MRETRTFGRNAVVELEVYNKCKYMMDKDAEIRRVKFEISSWEIVDGQDAEEIEAHTDGSCIDDYHEYLVLHLTNGETATFRNSYVDMFRIGWGGMSHTGGTEMRKELEEKLFDLIYDMDMIGQEQELREAIAGASDEALVEMIRDYEEG